MPGKAEHRLALLEDADKVLALPRGERGPKAERRRWEGRRLEADRELAEFCQIGGGMSLSLATSAFASPCSVSGAG